MRVMGVRIGTGNEYEGKYAGLRGMSGYGCDPVNPGRTVHSDLIILVRHVMPLPILLPYRRGKTSSPSELYSLSDLLERERRGMVEKRVKRRVEMGRNHAEESMVVRVDYRDKDSHVHARL